MVRMLEHLPFEGRLRELASSALEKTGFWEGLVAEAPQ